MDVAAAVFVTVLVVLVLATSLRLALIDWRTGRLPNRLVGVMFGAAVGLIVAEFLLEQRAGCRLVDLGGGCADGSALSLWVTLGLTTLSLAGPLLLLNLVSPASTGFGDVKLAIVMSLLLGVRWWSALPSPVFVGFATLTLGLVLGLASALIFRRGERNVPLGPGLVVAGWVMATAVMIGGVG